MIIEFLTCPCDELLFEAPLLSNGLQQTHDPECRRSSDENERCLYFEKQNAISCSMSQRLTRFAPESWCPCLTSSPHIFLPPQILGNGSFVVCLCVVVFLNHMFVKVLIYPGHLVVEQVELGQRDSFLWSWRRFTSHPRGFVSSKNGWSVPDSVFLDWCNTSLQRGMKTPTKVNYSR